MKTADLAGRLLGIFGKLSRNCTLALGTWSIFSPEVRLQSQTIKVADIYEVARKAASNEGLDFFGIADLDVTLDASRYRVWLEEKRHASMAWMERHIEIRTSPDLLLPNATSAFSFGFPYYLGDRWHRPPTKEKPFIAQYARLKDYHSFLRQKVSRVQKHIENTFSRSADWRVTVDSAPVLERALAFKSSGGFIGKNTCFIHPERGSFYLLAELFTTLPIVHERKSAKASNHQERTDRGGCGSCRRCQVHCPTGALDQDYRIDAGKCISYWTIEHRGVIPVNYWRWVGHYIFGCDICQLVCPYNRDLAVSDEARKLTRIQSTPDLMSMVQMNQEFYEKNFGGTPMTRAKISGLRRNALIASVVKNDPRIFAELNTLANDPDAVIVHTAKQVPDYLKFAQTTQTSL